MPVFYLHKHQICSILCDQIDFSRPGPEVSLYDLQTLLLQKRGRSVLIAAAYPALINLISPVFFSDVGFFCVPEIFLF